MSVRTIVRLGHPALREMARPLAPERLRDAAFQELVDDLVDTMRAAHGVGLAAPQVGEPLQVFVYELGPPAAGAAEPGEPSGPRSPAPPGAPSSRVPSPPPPGEPAADARGGSRGVQRDAMPAIPLHVVINPLLTPQGREVVYDWEGCLSIPDLRGLVPRHPAVRVRGLDRLGQPLDYVARDFEARIVQHEFDHLNGVVFLDRMRDFKTLAFREEWERYMAAGAAGPSDPAESPGASARSEGVLASAGAGDPEVI
jgi:peptide deformylase